MARIGKVPKDLVAFSYSARVVESHGCAVGGRQLLVHFEHECSGFVEFAVRPQAMDRSVLVHRPVCLLGDAPHGLRRIGTLQATRSFDAVRLGWNWPQCRVD